MKFRLYFLTTWAFQILFSNDFFFLLFFFLFPLLDLFHAMTAMSRHVSSKTTLGKEELFIQHHSQPQFPLHRGPPSMYAFRVSLKFHIATSKQYKKAISPEMAKSKKALETIFSYELGKHWQQTPHHHSSPRRYSSIELLYRMTNLLIPTAKPNSNCFGKYRNSRKAS